MTIKMSQTNYDAMVAYALSELPNEACGLVAGRISADVKLVEKVYLLRNIDRSAEHFSIDPKQQLAAIKDMRALGLSPLGNFHSHPQTPARPSEEDIRLARDASASYLILSLAGDAPVLKSFRVKAGEAFAEEVVIGG